MFANLETSSIFSILALSKFFAQNFSHLSWYPDWYLGNPFHYLIGPVVPFVLYILYHLLPISLYYLYIGLILVSLLVSGGGMYFFLRDLGVEKRPAVYSGALFLFSPLNLLLLASQNGLKHISFALLPFIFLYYHRFLLHKKTGDFVLLTIFLTALLLTNIYSLIAVIIGFVCIFVSLIYGKNIVKKKMMDREEGVVKSFLIIVLSLSFSAFWYTPSFFWVVLANPAFGGIPLGNLFFKIFNFLLQFLPLIFAVVIVRWRRYRPSGALLFAGLFFISFLFLSIYRFLSDPDFVMDWIGFGLELGFGGAILFVSFTNHMSFLRKQESIAKKWIPTFVGMIIIGIFIVLSGILIKELFGYSNSAYKTDILSLLGSHKNRGERYFFSGSPVFWINSELPLKQVRGGNDNGSIHPSWADGAYQIREGEKVKLADDWLKIFGVTSLLVHDKNSQEPFHDFKHIEKYIQHNVIPTEEVRRVEGSHASEQVNNPTFDLSGDSGDKDSSTSPSASSVSARNDTFELVEQKSGNILYNVMDASIARVADASLLRISKPKNGADEQALDAYVQALQRPASLKYLQPDTIEITADIRSNEVLSIAVTFDPSWALTAGRGKITRDALGNMIVIPESIGRQSFVMQYTRGALSMVIPAILSLISLAGLVFYHKISPHVIVKMPKLSLGLKDNDEDY